MKVLLTALVVLLGATTASLAQSVPNFGPNGPPNGDSFGKPYSGAQPLPQKVPAYRGWAYRSPAARAAHAGAYPRYHRTYRRPYVR